MARRKKVRNVFALGTFIAKRAGAKTFKEGTKGRALRSRITERLKAGKSALGLDRKRK